MKIEKLDVLGVCIKKDTRRTRSFDSLRSLRMTNEREATMFEIATREAGAFGFVPRYVILNEVKDLALPFPSFGKTQRSFDSLRSLRMTTKEA